MEIDYRGHLSKHWCKHLLGCQRKGEEAFRRGDSRDDCPYQVVNHYHTGPANLTRQRKSYWQYGWDVARNASEIERLPLGVGDESKSN